MLATSELVAFLSTTDYARARAFYEGVLGLRLVEETPFAHVYDANGVTVRIAKTEFTAQPFTVLGWNVTGLDEKMRALVAKGVAFERYGFLEQDALGAWSSPSGARVSWFKDPDGNLLSMTEWA